MRKATDSFTLRFKKLAFVISFALASTNVLFVLPAEAAVTSCFGERATIAGTSGSDALLGTSGEDVIVGRRGADKLRGGGGSDYLCGNGGNDIIRGGAGNDIIIGGLGSDVVSGGSGTDICEANCEETLDSDADGDGLSNREEIREYGTDPFAGDSDSDGASDGDEINGGSDPNTPDQVEPESDSDNDGVQDGSDNCSSVPNATQSDNDRDGAGDACDSDDDNDGFNDSSDQCPLTPGSEAGCAPSSSGGSGSGGSGGGPPAPADGDSDGVADGSDNCPAHANADQADLDNDGFGDVCDSDRDGDSVTNDPDPFPDDASEWSDVDGDGVGDNTDDDDDDDGQSDEDELLCDSDPKDDADLSPDTDGDSSPDCADDDDDNDGLADDAETGTDSLDPDSDEPDSAGYVHNYQWANDRIEVDPNAAPVVFTGTLDLTKRVVGSVAMIGLSDITTLANGGSDYQKGAYVYVSSLADRTVRLGVSDGNAGAGEVVQAFTTIPAAMADAGPLTITFTINGSAEPSECAKPISRTTPDPGIAIGCLTLVANGVTVTDDYGRISGSTGDEFASGAVFGWEAFPESGETGISFALDLAGSTLAGSVGEIVDANATSGMHMLRNVGATGDGYSDGPDDPDGEGPIRPNDNCPIVYNPHQTDTDADGLGDACDTDDDNDGLADDAETETDPFDPDSDGDATSRAGYSHNYQWASPRIEVDPNAAPVAFEGTLDLRNRVPGSVAMIGLSDLATLAAGGTDHQKGVYIYAFTLNDRRVRLGVSDGNTGTGEIVQAFTTISAATADAGPHDISFTINGSADPTTCAKPVSNTSPDPGTATGCLTLVAGGVTVTDDYGRITGSGGEEFASGGTFGWEAFPESGATGVSFDLDIDGSSRVAGNVGEVIDIYSTSGVYILRHVGATGDGYSDGPGDPDGEGPIQPNDNCPLVFNPDQTNADGDSGGDACDDDDDDDGLPDDEETTDGEDGVITDPLNSDTDGDGVGDSEDDFPLDVSEDTDTDADGTGDNGDSDDDNDGLSDTDEATIESDPKDPNDPIPSPPAQ